MKKAIFSGKLSFFLLASLALVSCGQFFSVPETKPSTEVGTGEDPIVPGSGDLAFENSLLESDLSTPSYSEAPRALSASSSKVLILMYHHLINAGTPEEYDRTVADFRNDMSYLRSKGIVVIDFDDLLAIQAGTMLPPAERLAIISFDDGYASMYKYAFPILKEFAYKATFFLITSYIANPSGNLDESGKPYFLRWKEVKEMSAYRDPATGSRLFTMGSHTVDHPFLQDRASSFATRNAYLQWLNKELNQSKTAIERNVSQGAMFLALPYGDGYGNSDIIAAAKRFNYKGIRTSKWGSFSPADVDNFKLKSLPILGDTDIAYVDTAFTY